jgi:hypothetical protein
LYFVDGLIAAAIERGESGDATFTAAQTAGFKRT